MGKAAANAESKKLTTKKAPLKSLQQLLKHIEEWLCRGEAPEDPQASATWPHDAMRRISCIVQRRHLRLMGRERRRRMCGRAPVRGHGTPDLGEERTYFLLPPHPSDSTRGLGKWQQESLSRFVHAAIKTKSIAAEVPFCCCSSFNHANRTISHLTPHIAKVFHTIPTRTTPNLVR